MDPSIGLIDDEGSGYWNGLGLNRDEPDLPDLSIQRNMNTAETPRPQAISGRRVVSLMHFIAAIRCLDAHSCPQSKEGRFVLQYERKVGLWSELTFRCSGCNEVRKVSTDPVQEPTPLGDNLGLGVNDAAIWAFMSIGCGHSHLEEVMSVMEVPAMSKGAFIRREDCIGKVG